MATEDPEFAPWAAVNLGYLLKSELGDPAAAVGAYRIAIESGHGEQAPKAAFNLGVLLAQLGDRDEAAAAYKAAIAADHPQYSVQGALRLAALQHASGDIKAARSTLRSALRFKDPAASELVRAMLRELKQRRT